MEAVDIGALVYSALSKGAKKVQDWADSQEVHDEDQLHGSGSQILSSVCDLRCYIESSMVSTEEAVSNEVQDAVRDITSEIESLRVLIAKMDETTKVMSNHMKIGSLLPHQTQEEMKFVDADPSTFAEVLKCGQLSDSPSIIWISQLEKFQFQEGRRVGKLLIAEVEWKKGRVRK